MKDIFKKSESGAALTIAIITLVALTGVAGYAMTQAYHQKKLVDTTSGKRIIAYYRAQAGVVHACWRIRTNYTTGLSPAGSFLTDAYDPNPYSIDVDGDSVNDTTIDIGPVNGATGLRTISSRGATG